MSESVGKGDSVVIGDSVRIGISVGIRVSVIASVSLRVEAAELEVMDKLEFGVSVEDGLGTGKTSELDVGLCTELGGGITVSVLVGASILVDASVLVDTSVLGYELECGPETEVTESLELKLELGSSLDDEVETDVVTVTKLVFQ